MKRHSYEAGDEEETLLYECRNMSCISCYIYIARRKQHVLEERFRQQIALLPIPTVEAPLPDGYESCSVCACIMLCIYGVFDVCPVALSSLICDPKELPHKVSTPPSLSTPRFLVAPVALMRARMNPRLYKKGEAALYSYKKVNVFRLNTNAIATDKPQLHASSRHPVASSDKQGLDD
jgi:hypothetical protein